MSQFCYWQIFKDVDFYILIAIGCIAFLILIYTTKQFISIVKLFRKIDYKVTLIYLFCTLWALLYVVKIIFLLIEYALVFKDSQGQNDMFQVSQLFCVIDTLPTFFLMYLLILIPYFWLKNITDFLASMRRNQKVDKIILKFFTFYIYVRILIFLVLFISQVSIKEESTVETLCDSLIIIILCEVFLSFGLLCYGLIKMFRNFSSLNVHDKKQKRKFINEYLIMICCSFTRFAMDFYYIIYQKTLDDQKNCFQYRSTDYIYTTLYVVFGQILMHLAPILTILFIYRVDFKAVIQDSLLSSQKSKGRKV